MAKLIMSPARLVLIVVKKRLGEHWSVFHKLGVVK